MSVYKGDLDELREYFREGKPISTRKIAEIAQRDISAEEAIERYRLQDARLLKKRLCDELGIVVYSVTRDEDEEPIYCSKDSLTPTERDYTRKREMKLVTTHLSKIIALDVEDPQAKLFGSDMQQAIEEFVRRKVKECMGERAA